MPLSSELPPASVISPAKAYERAHAGKLMVVQRKEAKEPTAGDFFRFDQVGTHPTGLIVTGIFQDSRRAHMMATTVRDADAAEIAWLAAETNSAPMAP